MKFKLPRQIGHEEISAIIKKAVDKQQIIVTRTTPARLLQLQKVALAIKNEGLPHYLVCKKLPEALGHGIFLRPEADPIPRGALIGPYAGLVSLTPQDELEDTLYGFSLLTDIYLDRDEQEIVSKGQKFNRRRKYALNLDAEKKGNFTRYINHSDKPNVAAHLYKIPKNPYGLTPSPLEVFYIAKKKILPGEQLLVSYEEGDDSYWSVLKIKPVPITPRTFLLKKDGKFSLGR